MQITRTRQHLIIGAVALVVLAVALADRGGEARGVRARKGEPGRAEQFPFGPLLDGPRLDSSLPGEPLLDEPPPTEPPLAKPHFEEPRSDELVLPEPSSLVDLRARPAHWLGRPVHLTLQFQGVVEAWNPFHTRFGPVAWLGFTAWADERFTWDRDVYEDPAPRLFVRRDGDLARTLGHASTHDRFAATVLVREVFLDEPWVEVLSLTKLDEHVPEGTILHVNHGRAFLAEGHLDMARQQFVRARAGPLPAHARAEIDRLLEVCGVAAGAGDGDGD